jgi:thiamine biosynthesis protein ThiC
VIGRHKVVQAAHGKQALGEGVGSAHGWIGFVAMALLSNRGGPFRGSVEVFQQPAKGQRINIRLSAGDLRDTQVKAMQEGMPYQTLIASVLHKYVTGRLAEKSPVTQSGTNGAA